MEIDFVITWVDMNDPKWKQDFAKYSGKIDNTKNEVSEARFRDHGLLKYWFRGVEKFAPWVRKIHFVTCGQRPEWLNTAHPKLVLVNHEDYIPKEYLPVFNSSLIEIYLHKIPNLVEHFVYFNDDFFITNHITEERFFKNGLPNDIAAFRLNFGLSLWSKCLKNNIRLINKHFDKKEVLKRDRDKWYDESYGSRGKLTKRLSFYDKFVTLRTPHNAQPYLKATFEEVWDKEGDELKAMSVHKFRSPKDYTQELFRTWQICKSNFNAYNTYQNTKMFPLLFKTEKAIKAIKEQAYSLVCINDNEHMRNYEQTMARVEDAFNSILPEKSNFEL
ncbi:Stealth CR1 domain-containing protein [Pedobacter sp. SL55]|uniref:Stealth CR1 domain-containing protein n=1 Tax=Pedobacter sp. SL55 TaxID=2995161 RepID=UPI00226D4E23|nr:Stealth CR1 domain-containing protein [Pedobacter sp. SL55]WAC41238.1 Stealth CR1 domain-containing protein [Pedobacter sp. SL55]